jgi:hypothetical protein
MFGSIILALPVVVAVIVDTLIIGDSTVKLSVTDNDSVSELTSELVNVNVGVNVAILF